MKSGSGPIRSTPSQDFCTAAVLFAVTAAFVLWQNLRVAVLWDLGYLLDISWRIALGQMPYRDFPLVHAPVTFLMQAALMRLAGRHATIPMAYAAVAGGLGTVLSWRIVLGVLRGRVAHAWTVSLLLAAPLTVLGVDSIYPHPIYDCDCALAILAAIALLQRLELPPSASANAFRPLRWLRPAIAGVAVALPVFCKQNMGVPFVLAVVAGIALLLVAGAFRRPKEREPVPSRATLAIALAAIAGALAAGTMLIQATAGLHNYLRWTIEFAAQRRLPGVAEILAVYRQPSLAWTLPAMGLGILALSLQAAGPALRRVGAGRDWLRIAACSLLAAPLLWSLIFPFLNDDMDDRADNLLALWPLLLIVAAVLAVAGLRRGLSLGRLLPFFVLAAIHGTFLSQQLWGSTYAIWPLLMLLVAQMLASLPPGFAAGGGALMLSAVVCAGLLIPGALYTASLERLSYIHLPPVPVSRATLPPLHGLSARGPYLGDFEELVRFAGREIPLQDGLMILPGEEPFYFATGRAPKFPVLLFDRTTDPYSPAELLLAARQRQIQWVIVKTRLQSTEDPTPDGAQVLALVAREFALYRRLSGYDIYRRR